MSVRFLKLHVPVKASVLKKDDEQSAGHCTVKDAVRTTRKVHQFELERYKLHMS
jgi:hypothetical protein